MTAHADSAAPPRLPVESTPASLLTAIPRRGSGSYQRSLVASTRQPTKGGACAEPKHARHSRGHHGRGVRRRRGASGLAGRLVIELWEDRNALQFDVDDADARCPVHAAS